MPAIRDVRIYCLLLSHFSLVGIIFGAILRPDNYNTITPPWSTLHFVQCPSPHLLQIGDHKYISHDELQFSSVITRSTQPSYLRNLTSPHPTKVKKDCSGNCALEKWIQNTCDSGQARPRHQSDTRCVYLSVSTPFIRTKEIDLI